MYEESAPILKIESGRRATAKALTVTLPSYSHCGLKDLCKPHLAAVDELSFARSTAISVHLHRHPTSLWLQMYKILTTADMSAIGLYKLVWYEEIGYTDLSLNLPPAKWADVGLHPTCDNTSIH